MAPRRAGAGGGQSRGSVSRPHPPPAACAPSMYSLFARHLMADSGRAGTHFDSVGCNSLALEFGVGCHLGKLPTQAVNLERVLRGCIHQPLLVLEHLFLEPLAERVLDPHLPHLLPAGNFSVCFWLKSLQSFGGIHTHVCICIHIYIYIFIYIYIYILSFPANRIHQPLLVLHHLFLEPLAQRVLDPHLPHLLPAGNFTLFSW